MRPTLTLQLPTVIQRDFRELGLHKIVSQDYATTEREEKIAVAKVVQMMRLGMMAKALLVTGKAKDEEEATKMAAEMEKRLQRYWEDGWKPTLAYVSVVRQRVEGYGV